jgi:inosine-uridine nucleoside N-ribohydrolase
VGRRGWVLPAAASLLAARLLMPYRRCRCRPARCAGVLTRGMSVFDWNGLYSKKPNVQLVTQIDMEALMAVMNRSTD